MVSLKAWRPLAVIRLVLALFISLFAGLCLMKVLAWQAPDWNASDQRFANLVVGTLTLHLAFLILVGMFLRSEGMTWREAFGFANGPLGRGLLLAGLAAGVLLPITFYLARMSAEVMTQFHFDPEPQAAVEALREGAWIGQQIYLGLIAIVLAPLAEEILFRGILYPTIKQLGYPRVALFGTSIVFAAIHANLMTLVPLILLAIVLALLYEASNNLLVPIVTHSLFNTFNFIWLVKESHAAALGW